MLATRKCLPHSSLCHSVYFIPVRFYAKKQKNEPIKTIPDNSPLPVFPHPPKPPEETPYQILFNNYGGKEALEKQNAIKKIARYHPMSFNLADAMPTDAPPLLTREYIYDSLYNNSYGYFSSKEEIINPDSKINFKELKGAEQYYKNLKENYDSGPKSAWLTPVEIFKPWYGYALANYIQQTHSKLPPGTPLKIFEMGGGLGTCADTILTYLQTNFPELYKNTSYTIIEISPTLAQKQTQKLAHHSQTGSQRVQIKRASIFDWTERIDDECFFIGLEVFDNFPHDKIVRYGGKGGWYEAIVRQNTNGTYYEDFRPVSDPLIRNYLAFSSPSLLQRFSDSFHSFITRFQSSSPALRAPHQITYIPTMAFWFLQILFSCFPRHKLILADFSHLPSLSEGLQAPVVQKKTGEKTIEFSHYLVPKKGSCDIFFPTNFRSLQRYYNALATEIQSTHPPRHHSTAESTKNETTKNEATKNEPTKNEVTKRETQVLSNRNFMKIYADLEHTSTASGYNPLLEDYANMKFFLSK